MIAVGPIVTSFVLEEKKTALEKEEEKMGGLTFQEGNRQSSQGRLSRDHTEAVDQPL